MFISFDNGKIKVYRSKSGFNWTRRNDDGTLSGNIGYGTVEAALRAARS